MFGSSPYFSSHRPYPNVTIVGWSPSSLLLLPICMMMPLERESSTPYICVEVVQGWIIQGNLCHRHWGIIRCWRVEAGPWGVSVQVRPTLGTAFLWPPSGSCQVDQGYDLVGFPWSWVGWSDLWVPLSCDVDSGLLCIFCASLHVLSRFLSMGVCVSWFTKTCGNS